MEKLLGEVQPLSRAEAAAGALGEEGGAGAFAALPAEALEGQCRLLDRVCSEVSRLNFFSAKGQVGCCWAETAVDEFVLAGDGRVPLSVPSFPPRDRWAAAGHKSRLMNVFWCMPIKQNIEFEDSWAHVLTLWVGGKL